MRKAIEILEYSPNKSINIKSFKNDMILLYTSKILINFLFYLPLKTLFYR